MDDKGKGSTVLGATAWFVNRYHSDGSVYFGSAISRDLFQIDGEDYTDLIPYAKEHEVQESYLRILIKKGLLSEKDTHKKSMKAEYELAAQDSKHHKLYDFMKKISPERAGEYQEAYDLVNDL